MSGYRTPDFAPEYAVEIWTDDLHLIATTEVTDDRMAAVDQLERLRCGYRMARLKWRTSRDQEWRECGEGDLTRAAFRQACAAADALAAAAVPFVNWTIYTSGAEARLLARPYTPDALQLIDEYSAFFEVETATDGTDVYVDATYRGVTVRMQARAKQEVAA